MSFAKIFLPFSFLVFGMLFTVWQQESAAQTTPARPASSSDSRASGFQENFSGNTPAVSGDTPRRDGSTSINRNPAPTEVPPKPLSENPENGNETPKKTETPFPNITAEEYPWVFIPVDENGTPSGGNYYIPLEMFRKLHQETNAETAAERDTYFYHHASYAGKLRASSAPGSADALILDTITATFDLEVLAADTRVRLPMRASEIHLSAGASLNNVPVMPLWEDEKLAFDIPKPGRYTLILRFYPVTANSSATITALPPTGVSPGVSGAAASSPSSTSAGNTVPPGTAVSPASAPLSAGTAPDGVSGIPENEITARGGIRFSIPPVPTAFLELEAPANFEEPDFPGARGKTTYNARTQKWQVHLGGTDQLCILWKKTPRSETLSPTVSAEEFYHWKFTPRGITLQCRFRYRVPKGNITSLEWVTDPRAIVRALPGTDGIPGNGTGTEPGGTSPIKTSTPSGVTETPSGVPSPRGTSPYTDGNAGRENTSGGTPGNGSAGRESTGGISGTGGSTPAAISENAGTGAFQIKTFADGTRQRIRADFPAPLTGQITLGFDIHFPEKSGIGKYVFPWIHPKDVKTVRRWIAVSGSEMEIALRQSPGKSASVLAPAASPSTPISASSALTIPEFLSVWAELAGNRNSGRTESAITPAFVVDDTNSSPSAVPSWFVETSPRRAVHTVSETLSFLCRPEHLDVQYTATFSVTDTLPYFCHLRIPEGCRVKQIFLREDGRKIPVRHTRISSTTLGIFIENSLSHRLSRDNRFLHGDPLTMLFPPPTNVPSPPQLVLEGMIPFSDGGRLSPKVAVSFGETDIPPEQKIPLPNISLSDSDFSSGSRNIKIYRGNEVLVDFEDIPPEVFSRSNFSSSQPGVNGLSPDGIFASAFTLPQNIPGILSANMVYLAEGTGGDFRNTRLCADLSFREKEKITGTLILRENRPSVEIRKRTFMESAGESGRKDSAGDSRSAAPGKEEYTEWNARMELLLDVRDGLLDELVVELPPNWRGPFTLEPPIPFTLETYLPENAPAENSPETPGVFSPDINAASSGENPEVPADSGKYKDTGLPINPLTEQAAKTRMIIRPVYPFHARQRLTITAGVRETRNPLVKGEVSYILPRVQFPGVKTVQEEIFLPALPEKMSAAGKSAQWILEGMEPIPKSRLDFSPEKESAEAVPAKEKNAGTESAEKIKTGGNDENTPAGTFKNSEKPENPGNPGNSQNPSGGKENPSSAEKITEKNPPPKLQNTPLSNSGQKAFRIYRVTGAQSLARLLVTSTVPPKVEHLWTSHHILWDSHLEKDGKVRFLVLTVFDILPRQAPGCTVAIPENAVPLEFRLDGLPAQVEGEPKSPTDAENHRLYHVSFHSTAFPKRLEILSFHETSRRAVQGTPASRIPRGITPKDADFVFSLKLPRLYAAAVSPENEDVSRGICFLYLPEPCDIKLWRWKTPQAVTPVLPRPPLRMEVIRMEHLIRIARLAAAGNEGSPFPAEKAEKNEHPALTPEAIYWNMLWTPLWRREILTITELLRNEGKNDGKTDLREFHQNYETLRREGDRFFGKWPSAGKNGNAESPEETSPVRNWKSLEQAFLENLPFSVKVSAKNEAVSEEFPISAFRLLTYDFGTSSENRTAENSRVRGRKDGVNPPETADSRENLLTGVGELFLTEEIPASESRHSLTFVESSWYSPHIFAAILVLFITASLLVGHYLFPSVLKITRTTPYWLFCGGILWILCDFPRWPVILIFLLAIFVVILRAKEATRNAAS